MKNNIQEYSKSLSAHFSQIEVTDLSSQSLDFEEAANEAFRTVSKTKTNSGKIIFIGNGGSAAIASHQAVDFWKNGGVRAIAFNDSSLLTCISNDYGYEHVFEKPVDMFAESSDVLIAISSSGKSKNILNAVQTAKSKNCFVITLSGFQKNNPIRQLGHLNFYVPSDSYGFVEISHLIICHFIADRLCAENQTSSRPAISTGKKN
jgi:D-sedoheptulose 7-phosphate isomerase